MSEGDRNAKESEGRMGRKARRREGGRVEEGRTQDSKGHQSEVKETEGKWRRERKDRGGRQSVDKKAAADCGRWR